MRKIILLIITILTTLFHLQAQEIQPNVKKLSYLAYYNLGLIWINAGQVEFKLNHSNLYPNALHLKAHGYTQPSWDWIFKVRDTLDSHYNSETFVPYKFERLAHEGNYHKTFKYKFNYQDSLIYSDVHRQGRVKEQDTIKLQSNTYDMLSVAWMAREIDFSKLKTNHQIPISLLIDRKIHHLYIRYHGVQTEKIANKKRECYVFSPLLVKGEMFEEGEGMKVYISKDKYRIPLMIEAKIIVGSVKAIINFEDSDLSPISATNN